MRSLQRRVLELRAGASGAGITPSPAAYRAINAGAVGGDVRNPLLRTSSTHPLETGAMIAAHRPPVDLRHSLRAPRRPEPTSYWVSSFGASANSDDLDLNFMYDRKHNARGGGWPSDPFKPTKPAARSAARMGAPPPRPVAVAPPQPEPQATAAPTESA